MANNQETGVLGTALVVLPGLSQPTSVEAGAPTDHGLPVGGTPPSALGIRGWKIYGRNRKDRRQED
jgi:hypothetical protein